MTDKVFCPWSTESRLFKCCIHSKHLHLLVTISQWIGWYFEKKNTYFKASTNYLPIITNRWRCLKWIQPLNDQQYVPSNSFTEFWSLKHWIHSKCLHLLGTIILRISWYYENWKRTSFNKFVLQMSSKDLHILTEFNI